ncbi:MAG: GNAT family N-acetyltransferase [Bullifex sp.]
MIRNADLSDVPSWMSLAWKVASSFPGMDAEEHEMALKEFISNGEALLSDNDGKVTGALLFSKEASTLCFLAVDPDHRREHIARDLVEHMLSLMDAQRDITVTTYRDDVPEGRPARAFYLSMGFVPLRLTEEFGSPVEEFVLKARQLPSL